MLQIENCNNFGLPDNNDLELKHSIALKRNIIGPFDVMMSYWVLKMGVNINKIFKD